MTLHIIYCGRQQIHGSLIASPMMPNDTAVAGGITLIICKILYPFVCQGVTVWLGGTNK